MQVATVVEHHGEIRGSLALLEQPGGNRLCVYMRHRVAAAEARGQIGEGDGLFFLCSATLAAQALRHKRVSSRPRATLQRGANECSGAACMTS